MLQELITENLSTILVFLTVTLTLRLYTQRPKNIPPGPWFTLPVIGNLLQVGSNPVFSFREMRKKYGDIFTVYFANRLVIVINGLDNLTDAFVKLGDVFSDRPNLFIFDLVSKNKGVLGSSGKVWKEQRKLTVTTLRKLGMGKNILEANIQEEVTVLVEELTRSKGKPIDVSELLSTSVSNVISSIAFGKRFQFQDPTFLKFLKIVIDTLETSPILSFFPYLSYVPGDVFHFRRKMTDVEMALKELVDPTVEEHLQHYDEDNVTDFTSAYIKEMKMKERRGETESHITIENLRATIWNLFIAGTEPTASSIRWLLLYFLYFPQVQDKCFAEINEKVGCDRPVHLKDKTELHYVNATIMETLRFGDVAPISAMRTVSKEIIFKGYRIPKDAVIIPLIDSVLSDPKIWGDPENFRPERFLDENGRLIKSEANIPFLMGRRSCPGEALARMELFLFISTLVQKFKFVKPEGEVLPSFDGGKGFIFAPEPFLIKAVLRK